MAMQHQKEPYEFQFIPEISKVLLHHRIPGNEDDLYKRVDDMEKNGDLSSFFFLGQTCYVFVCGRCILVTCHYYYFNLVLTEVNSPLSSKLAGGNVNYQTSSILNLMTGTQSD